jgi:hypothetical protein
LGIILFRIISGRLFLCLSLDYLFNIASIVTGELPFEDSNIVLLHKLIKNVNYI